MSARVLLLTARDPATAGDGAHPLRVARDLALGGDDVTLVLLEDAVVVARDGQVDTSAVTDAIAAGARVLAEDEALARRGVTRLVVGVKPAPLGEVVDLLVDSDRQAWL